MRQVVETLSAYPLALFGLYLVALFAPRFFAWCSAAMIAVLIFGGLYQHFDTNYLFHADMMQRFGLIGPSQVDLAENPEYAKGLFHAMSITLAIAVLLAGAIAIRRRNKERVRRLERVP